jgi:predicted ATPase/class 3 adenylate cyclase
MRRLVSPFILERFAEGSDDGSLQAATLFADVAGFSAMTSALMEHGAHGSEVGAQVMMALFTPLVEAVYAHGGAITAFAGDSFIALFPAGTPEVDDRCMVRALAAATAMRQHLAGRPRYTTPWGSFDVGVKIGLAAGTVHWRILRHSDGRAAFYVRGPAIDGCTSIDVHAEPGDLVLHPSCRPLLRDAVTVEEIPASAVNGFELPCARVAAVGAALPDPLPVHLPAVDAAALAAFVPREIIEQTEVGEYRNVVNVFVNLPGEPDDAELRSAVQAIWDLQASFGGHLNSIAFDDKGCNLLLFWGAPVRFENDVARALHALLDLQRTLPHPLRAGVTTGISHAGFVGSDLHAGFTCFGQSINLAARLMTSAPWGEIWLDEAVQRRAAAEFVTSPIGERRFKGFAQPQPVFGLSDRRVEVERRFGGDMVGRDAELAALAAFVAPVHEGRPAGLLVVQGEAGMGKSRLVSEFLRAAGASASTAADGPSAAPTEDRPPLRVVAAPADAIVRRPFDPFRYWLRNRFARNPRASDGENKAAFDERFDALLAGLPDADLRRALERVRSVLGALVDLHWDGSLYSRLDPRGRYDHTLDAITDLILAESLCRPVVLVLEDIHWIDDGSAEVVRRLLRAASTPLAVIATSREADATFGATIGATVEHQLLALSRFARSDVATLATLILGSPPAPELLDLLESRADGNPFIAEQVVHFLRDEGLLQLAHDRWTVIRAAAAEASLPDDVKGIFVAQLDRLGRSARDVAQAASVLGREFSHHELTELVSQAGVDRTTVGPAIEAGRAAGIWAPIGTTRSAFRHVLLRDAAYDMQIRVRRAATHHRAAMVLERLWADDLEPHVVDISHHFESACHLGVDGARQPAVDYLARAGMQAGSTFASAAAADLFTRALVLTPDGDVAGRFQLLLEREWVNDARADRTAQAADVEALESLARRAGDPVMQAEASMRRAYVSSDFGDFTTALASSERALALARSAALVEIESTALRTGGAALRAMGRFDEALERFEQSIAVAQGAHLEYAEATAWTAWASLSARRGRWRAAASALERAAATFQRLGRIMRVAHALRELGMALVAGGRLAEAEVRFQQALAISREIGDTGGQVPTLFSLSYVLMGRGDVNGADAAAAEAAESADRLGDGHLLARALLARGRAALLSGDLPAARRFLAAVQTAADDEFPDLRSGVLAHRAALALLDGRLADAGHLAAAAIERARAVDDRTDLVLAVLYRSLTHEALGEFGAAEAGFREVIELERAMDAAPGQGWDARGGLVRILQGQGRLDVAYDEAKPIAAHLLAQANPVTADHGMGSCEQPLRVSLTVAKLLSALGDGDGDVIWDRAAALLSVWADSSEDPVRRRLLLDLPHHHDLLHDR